MKDDKWLQHLSANNSKTNAGSARWDKKTVFLLLIFGLGAVSAVYLYQTKNEHERLEKIAQVERAANKKIALQRAADERHAASIAARKMQPRARNIVEDAYALCALLRSGGASTCGVNSNLWSPSYIDATVPSSAAEATALCRQVKILTGKPGSPFIGSGWSLKLFSPFGNNRPIADCQL